MSYVFVATAIIAAVSTTCCIFQARRIKRQKDFINEALVALGSLRVDYDVLNDAYKEMKLNDILSAHNISQN